MGTPAIPDDRMRSGTFPMKRTRLVAAAVIVVLVGLAIYGIWATRQPPASTAIAHPQGKPLVVLRPLKTAQEMAQLATTPEGRTFAKEALRLADYDVDLAFDEAIRETLQHPPQLSGEATAAKKRLDKAQKALEAAQERAKQLSEQMAKTPESKQDTVEAALIQVEADLDLAQDEVDDAKHDLNQAGGDPVGRLRAMKEEHEATSKNTEAAIPSVQEPPEQLGLIHWVTQWRNLHQKQMQLWRAKSETETAEARLSAKHDALDAQIQSAKAQIPELSHRPVANSSGATSSPSAAPTPANELLKKTEELADQQKAVSAYDKRIEAKRQLGSVYAQWIDFVAASQRTVVHHALQGVLIILGIALVALFISSWIDSLLKRLHMDRRQVESLRTVTSVSLQVLAIFLILLVILGPPGQLGTFLGLAGAGLTVALKDFIVGFIGWFVLMGKNGMRLGDWVEINGVTGEVVEISPFHTVLLETGNWTDSGHPTGRRVTFTNSFAIEGHYFNFSTTGQWLWDELSVVLPAGKDPFPMLDAIHKKVIEATHETVQQAEQEWKNSTKSRELSGLSAAPAITAKPVIGGTEISVRYVTRASDRYALRAKLNQAAVELLGAKPEPVGAA